MRKIKTYLSGKELAEALPKMHMMRKRGTSMEQIAHTYDLGVGTVGDYLHEYRSYLRGSEVRNIARAIPYMVVTQAKMKFAEEQGRQPEQRGSYTKPKQQEVKRKQISLLWGLLKINW